MCDGVTQSQPGMELSLFSRDVIAMATAVALSHNVFDAVLCLGVCDKIVPGLLIGAMHFGHLPASSMPGGPIPSGLPNAERRKSASFTPRARSGGRRCWRRSRKRITHRELVLSTAPPIPDQMLMEAMGLHLPGAAFVRYPLRDALTQAAAQRAARITALGDEYLPVGRIVDERTIVNGIVGLLATGGSTNHTLHLVAIAHAAGISINWDDFSDPWMPLLADLSQRPSRRESLSRGGRHGFSQSANCSMPRLLHGDVLTVARRGLARYAGTDYGQRRAGLASGAEAERRRTCCVPLLGRSVPRADSNW
ncbi:MAG: dihydroxy-acid dehydratase [Candidatus Competibacteraceae bacterium]